ncbi:hypothetical protein ACOMHN_004063 [Nucella lapillus]
MCRRQGYTASDKRYALIDLALSEGDGRPGRPKPTTSNGAGGGASNSLVPCCRNGGLCYLGSFCNCPQGFYGRYCEYEVKKNSCRNIPHGSWVKAGCNLCRCFDGHLTCLPRAFDGCDDKPPTDDAKVNPWDYKDEMVIISKGTIASHNSADDGATTDDSSYDDYYTDNSGGSGSSGGRSGATRTSVLPGSPFGLALFSLFIAASWRWLTFLDLRIILAT